MKNLVSVVVLIFGTGTYLGYIRADELRLYLEDRIGPFLIDASGYLGGALQLGAVVAVSRGWLDNTSSLYHAMSLVGSTGLLATAFYHEAYAPVLVNIIWMAMNTVGIMEGVSNMEALSMVGDAI
tara:strand:- start:559 stop:933 length:375 start_codon:yes stop_codon:yes gene_type:complete